MTEHDREIADNDECLREFVDRYSFMSQDATRRSRGLFVWGLCGWTLCSLLAAFAADIPRRWLGLLPVVAALALICGYAVDCWLLCRPPRRRE